MVEHGGPKKEVDPEELLRQKFRMKCLFRALGRKVVANAHWLIEASDYYEGLDNVKLRVEQAVRGTGKKKQLLNINDKTLLNKPAQDRTDLEKKYLYRIIGGLKCFKRYPNNVKKKLAAVTYFRYYGPGRTIVRQHHEAHALYFIVTGDVTVSQMVYDELLQQHVSVEVGVMHPGDMFGEVSLLHNIPRTATVTTTGHCEMLALLKEDFKNVLQASVQKEWDEVRRAMSAFTYFDGLDEVARREGCIVAKMKSYDPNETILGDGAGVPNFVYFMLSGKCQMIESMQVVVTKHLGRHYYSLYDPHLSKEVSEEGLEAKYFGPRKSKDNASFIPNTATTSRITDIAAEGTQSSAMKRSKQSSSIKTESVHMELSDEDECNIEAQECRNLNSNEFLKSAEFKNFNSNEYLKSTDQFRDSLRVSVPNPLPPLPLGNLRTYFMQVCQFNPGSSFGFGENMRDRRIVALTPVSCMLLPLVWLLQRNTANIWTRIKYYLDKKIPNKKQLFKEFVVARRWTEYREQLVTDVVARSNTVNYTSVHDVPYSIRLEEKMDL